MIIILEGLDRLGKSTQAELLSKEFKIPVIHYTSPEDKLPQTQFKNFVNNYYEIYKNRLSQIHDRSIYGEYVYGPMYRKSNPNFIFTIENQFKELINKSYFILIEDSIKNILKRDDGKSFTINYFKKLKEKWLFRLVFFLSKCKYKKIISIKNKSIEQVNLEIITFLKSFLRKNI